MHIKDALRQAQTQLENNALDSPRLDAEILLARLLGKDRSYLFAWSDQRLTATEQDQFEQWITRRCQHEPVAYILGTRNFWDFTLKVNNSTLIPRPESEHLVELVLDQLLKQKASRILDLGTGSGAIAAAIAYERPDCDITATDMSKAALEQAQDNFIQLGLKVHCRLGRWFECLPNCQPFNVIVSNPPYICEQDPHLSQGDLAYEPLSALVSGKDGLNDIRHIIQHAPDYLLDKGMLLLEHGYDQANAVAALLIDRGFDDVHCIPDLAGQDRVSVGIFHLR